MNNPLLQSLTVIETLSRYGASLQTLGNVIDASPATTKRCISEARLLGADIVSARVGGLWVYELRNWPACSKRVTQWIELEKARTVI